MTGSVMLFEDLDEVERDAGSALNRWSQPRMFDRLDWFKLAASHTLDGKPLIIKASNCDARCWIFLSQQGPFASAMSNWYCLRYGTVTHAPGNVKPPIDALVAGLKEAGVSHLFLAPIGGDDPLPDALRAKGWLTRREQVNVSWRIDTRGMSFEDYWAGRPTRLQNTAKRKTKKADLDLVFHDRFDADAWVALEGVFEASWKLAEGSPNLIRDIAKQEGEAGSLRLGLAYKDGLAVAAQIWTVENGVATIHKLAYREEVKELSAGTILSVEMFRRALNDDHVDMIDFGVGDDAYKRDWMTHCVPLYALSAYYPFRSAGLIGLAKAAGRKILPRSIASGANSGGRPVKRY